MKDCRNLANDIGKKDKCSCTIVAEDEGRVTRYYLKKTPEIRFWGIVRA